MSDAINHPEYYNKGDIEVLEFIEDQRMDFVKGSAIKYICRAGGKDPTKEVEDMGKAMFYVRRHIEHCNAEKQKRKACKPNDMDKRYGPIVTEPESAPCEIKLRIYDPNFQGEPEPKKRKKGKKK